MVKDTGWRDGPYIEPTELAKRYGVSIGGTIVECPDAVTAYQVASTTADGKVVMRNDEAQGWREAPEVAGPWPLRVERPGMPSIILDVAPPFRAVREILGGADVDEDSGGVEPGFRREYEWCGGCGDVRKHDASGVCPGPTAEGPGRVTVHRSAGTRHPALEGRVDRELYRTDPEYRDAVDQLGPVLAAVEEALTSGAAFGREWILARVVHHLLPTRSKIDEDRLKRQILELSVSAGGGWDHATGGTFFGVIPDIPVDGAADEPESEDIERDRTTYFVPDFPICEVRTECDRCPHTHPFTFVGDGRHASSVHPHDATIIYLINGVERHRMGVAGGTRWIVNANGSDRIQIISL